MDLASGTQREIESGRRDGHAVRVDFYPPCATAHCPNCAQADLLQRQIRDLGRELRALKMRAGSVVFARMRWCLAMLLKAAKAGEVPPAKVFRRADDVLAKVYE